MPTPLHLVSPETGKTYPLDDVRLLAYGDPELRAAGYIRQSGARLSGWDVHAGRIRGGLRAAARPVGFSSAAPRRRRRLRRCRSVRAIRRSSRFRSNSGTLFLKDESRNPTWSHKDRAMTVAVTVAQGAGAPHGRRRIHGQCRGVARRLCRAGRDALRDVHGYRCPAYDADLHGRIRRAALSARRRREPPRPRRARHRAVWLVPRHECHRPARRLEPLRRRGLHDDRL